MDLKAPGHEAAVDAGDLFFEHARFVAGFLRHRLGVAATEVDDLVQEVFLVAHRRGGFVPGPACARTWLAEIALRVAQRSRRTRRRRPEDSDSQAVLQVPAESPDPARAADVAESLARVQAALGALNLRERAVFVLYEIEGEECAAIAAVLGVPVGTVYSRLHTARRKFMRAHARLQPPIETAVIPQAVRLRT